jgi:hypothetical protein
VADDKVHPIEKELQGERAAALGEAGRRIERALAELGTDEDSLYEAATAVWYYMIVRESLRMYDHNDALAFYDVPARVMAKVGVIRK